MVMHQRIEPPFPGDDDANLAVFGQVSRVAEYAELTKRIATGRFRSEAERNRVLGEAIRMRSDIVSRARSGGIVDSELPKFWEAVAQAATERFRRKITIHPLPCRQAARQSPDAEQRALDFAVIQMREKRDRARTSLAKAEALLIEAELAAKAHHSERGL